ncbi:hypothetical protein CCYA_CCYA02G0516 [Cyanidiococcus yangmingshanensis]|nr:hypothetical protein CCYA_CCYA02G0516 [Cyanidiococcus yangmingshanensis]
MQAFLCGTRSLLGLSLRQCEKRVSGQSRYGVASTARGRQSPEQAAHSRREQRKQEHSERDWGSLLALLNERITGLPQLLGFRVDHVEHGRLVASLPIKPSLLAGNGYLHAGTVVTLADTACGYGCYVSLPPERVNFATVQLSSQFLGTALNGELEVEAWLRHAGKSTQVWDAEVRSRATSQPSRTAQTIALFRCTQLLLEAKSGPKSERPSDNETYAAS